jgi:hypothetical protein
LEQSGWEPVGGVKFPEEVVATDAVAETSADRRKAELRGIEGDLFESWDGISRGVTDVA